MCVCVVFVYCVDHMISHQLSCFAHLDTIAATSIAAAEIVADIKLLWRQLDIVRSGRVVRILALRKLQHHWSIATTAIGARWMRRLKATPTHTDGAVQFISVWDFAAATFKEYNLDRPRTDQIQFTIPDYDGRQLALSTATTAVNVIVCSTPLSIASVYNYSSH